MLGTICGNYMQPSPGGPDKVRFICLWNRKGGDGPGGTEHMYETVQKYSGRVYVLDTNVLW